MGDPSGVRAWMSRCREVRRSKAGGWRPSSGGFGSHPSRRVRKDGAPGTRWSPKPLRGGWGENYRRLLRKRTISMSAKTNQKSSKSNLLRGGKMSLASFRSLMIRGIFAFGTARSSGLATRSWQFKANHRIYHLQVSISEHRIRHIFGIPGRPEPLSSKSSKGIAGGTIGSSASISWRNA